MAFGLHNIGRGLTSGAGEVVNNATQQANTPSTEDVGGDAMMMNPYEDEAPAAPTPQANQQPTPRQQPLAEDQPMANPYEDDPQSVTVMKDRGSADQYLQLSQQGKQKSIDHGPAPKPRAPRTPLPGPLQGVPALETLRDIGNPDRFDKDPIINVGVDKHTRMSYYPAKGLSKAMKEAKAAGITIDPFGPMTSYRTFDQQAGLHAKMGKWAAPAGNSKATGSLHQHGFAIDVSSDNYDKLDPIMAKYGFARSVSGEAWHYSFQPALAKDDHERVWKDNDPRMLAWSTRLGVGSPGSIDDNITNLSYMRGLGPKGTSVMHRLFEKESGKRTKDESGGIITSPAGAMGIGQMTMPTLQPYLRERGIGFKEYEDNPHIQIDIATQHFAALTKKYNGNLAKAAAAYNGGPLSVDEAEKGGWNMNSTDPSAWSNETLDYVANLLDVDEDTAMAWIAAPRDQVPPEAMSDAAPDVTDQEHVEYVKKSGTDWLKEALGAVADLTFGEGAEATNVDPKQDPNAPNMSGDVEYGVKAFMRAATASVIDNLIAKEESYDQPPTMLGALGSLIKGPAGLVEYGGRHLTGSADTSALKKIASLVSPDESYHKGIFDDINRDRGGAESFMQWLGGLPWSKDDGGYDIDMKSLGANTRALGMEIPSMMGSIAGMMLMGPEQGLTSKVPFKMLGSDTAEQWLKNQAAKPNSTAFLSRFFDKATLGASGGLANAGKKMIYELGDNLENTATYTVLGMGQAYLDAYGQAYHNGASHDEATAAGVTSMFVGGLLGMALPLGMNRHVLKAGQKGLVNAGEGLSSALGTPIQIPREYPWASQAYGSVLDWLTTMNGKDKFFTRRINEGMMKYSRQSMENQKSVLVSKAIQEFEELAGTYDTAAASVSKIVENQKQYVAEIENRSMQSLQVAEGIENRQPLLSVNSGFGKELGAQLDNIDRMRGTVAYAKGLPPEERIQWAADNPDILEGAKAKNVDEFLNPGKNGVSKADEYINDLNTKVTQDAKALEISNNDLLTWHRARRNAEEMDKRMIDAQRNPVLRNLPEYEKTVEVLQSTAQHARNKANYVRENVTNPLAPLNPREVVDMYNIGNAIDDIADADSLMTKMEVFENSLTDAVEQATWMGGSMDKVAFEMTRGTRGVIESLGIDPRQTVDIATKNIEGSLNDIRTDISLVKQEIRNTKRRISYKHKEFLPETQRAKFEKQVDDIGVREDGLNNTLDASKLERESLQKQMKKLDQQLLDDPTPENIDLHRQIIRQAKAAEKASVKAKSKLEANRKLADETTLIGYAADRASTQSTKAGLLHEGLKLAELVEDSKAQLASLERQYPKHVQNYQSKREGTFAKDIIKRTEENLEALLKKRDISKKLPVLDSRISGIETSLNDLNTRKLDLQAEYFFDGALERMDQRTVNEIRDMESQISAREKTLSSMSDLESKYLKDQESISFIREKTVTTTPSTRPDAAEEERILGTYGDLSSYDDAVKKATNAQNARAQSFNEANARHSKLMSDIGIKNIIDSTNPMRNVVQMFDDLSPAERTGLISQELLEFGEVYANMLEPSREAMREAGGVPSALSLRNGNYLAAKDSGVETWLGQEFMQAVQGIRASEITQENISTSPLSGYRKLESKSYQWDQDTATGVMNGLKRFVNLDTPTSVRETVNRGVNAWKTMTHQLNHSRNVSNRVREGWQQVVKQLPDEFTEGGPKTRNKGVKEPNSDTRAFTTGGRILKPEISTQMIDAIESLVDGNQGMTQFLQKYPTMQKPMQGFLSVINVLEKTKMASPELRSTFRDAYVQHIYPRVSEFRKLGYSVDFNQLSTTLSSEQRRKVATLADARLYYQEGIDSLDNAPGWGEYKPDTNAKLEDSFLKMSQNDRARVLGMERTAENATSVDKKVNNVINKLAMKDPVTDPGQIMEAMVKSTLDTAAQRSALKNVASIPVQNTFDPNLNRPLFGIEHTKGNMPPSVIGLDGKAQPYQVLSDITELGIKPHDTVTFGGKDYQARELSMHPEIAKEFVDRFAVNPQNKTEKGKRWAARQDAHKQMRLIGSPMAHAQNIFSGAWQTLMTNSVESMWNSAVGTVVGGGQGGRAQASREFAKAMGDLFNSPRDAMGIAIYGNDMLNGRIAGVDPQMVMSDALLHGVNMSTWNTAMKQGYEATLNLVRQEDGELAQEITTPTISQLATDPDTWARHVKNESLWGAIKNSGDPTDSGLKKAAHGAKTMAGAAMKGVVDTDRFLNNYFTYEPMKQAVVASYQYTAALHWNKMGQKLIDSGMEPSAAMTMVKQEAARYVNSRGGMIQHYLKSNVLGAINDSHIYGKDAKGESNALGMMFSPLTPGWLRSKIDFISNGMPEVMGGGKRLNDIPNQQYQNWAKKEWRKQLMLGGGATMMAQQMFKWAITGGGIMAAAFAADVGTQEWRERVRLELEDPRQWTELQVAPSTVLASPFQGQMRDVIRLVDGYRRPQAVLDMVMNQVGPLGRDMLAITQNTAAGLGNIRIDQTTVDPKARWDDVKRVAGFMAHSGAETIASEIFMQETGYTSGRVRKPMGAAAATLLGFQARTVNPSNRASSEVIRLQKQYRDTTEREITTRLKQWESTGEGLEEVIKFARIEGTKVTGKGLNPEYALIFPDGRDVLSEAEFNSLFLKTISPESAALLKEDEGFRLAYLKLMQKYWDQQATGLAPAITKALEDADKEYDERRAKNTSSKP